MCGINGYFQFSNKLDTNQIDSMINTMNDKIIHRGPDQDGLFVDEGIGLGMRRLSIIDLSTGKQPIFNEDKSLVIVFNGEIYNFRSLKTQLQNKGHTFSTNCDTEVILHSYEEYGEECFCHFDGMFSFAIYDLKKKNLLLARDRIGEKPLYYTKNNDFILFGSELKSLIKTKLFPKEISKIALCQYFELTYIPSPMSIFENVYKLEPGHFMKIDDKGNVSKKQYWDMDYKKEDLITDYAECKKMLRNALFHSVEERMIADVPLGAFLSGGIDSTTIVGIMAKLSKKPIETFTIGFSDKNFDESPRAKIVADCYKTNHHTYYIEYDEMQNEMDNILNYIDEPFADVSFLPTYMVSKYASKYVKTVLTGDAGDELFGGYNKYLIGYYSDKYNKIPKILRKNIIEKMVYLAPDKTPITRKIRKVVENSQKDIFSQRKELMVLAFSEQEKRMLFKSDYLSGNSCGIIDEYYKKYNVDELTSALYIDQKVLLEGDMLTKVDRMSMINSLETRVPLLGKEVLEVARRTPSEFKVNSKKLKMILRETFSDIIPPELYKAPKKGFSIPMNWVGENFREQLMKNMDKEFIEEQGIFNHSYIMNIIDEHFTGKKNRKDQIWALFVFQNWYKRFFID